MATLVQQRDELRKLLAQAQETIGIQNARISELTNQMMDKVEDSPLFKTQIESYKAELDTLRTAHELLGRDYKADVISAYEKGYKEARKKYLDEVELLDEEIRKMKAGHRIPT